MYEENVLVGTNMSPSEGTADKALAQLRCIAASLADGSRIDMHQQSDGAIPAMYASVLFALCMS